VSLVEGHRASKEALLAQLRRLAHIAEAAGMRTLAGDITRERIPKLEEERFHLVVLGEFNHGKSTFVNALLGNDILPTGITPTTASINHVVWAAQPTARVVLNGGESRYLDPTISTSSAPRSRTATCRAPTPWCSCSTPARRSRTASASSCAAACWRAPATG
jgi:hypothetical protein